MSRSYKKSPICGNSKAISEKQEKLKANRKIRIAERVNLRKHSIDSFENHITILPRDKGGSEYLRKDGKQYLDERDFIDNLDYFRKCLKK